MTQADHANTVREAIGALASALRSGEPMTARMEEAGSQAHLALDALQTQAETAEGLADFVIKDVWGVLLAYYTDIPEAEVQRLIARCESFNALLHA